MPETVGGESGGVRGEVRGVGDDEGETTPRRKGVEPVSAPENEASTETAGVLGRKREGLVRAVRCPDVRRGEERAEGEREGPRTRAEIEETRPGRGRKEIRGEGDEGFGLRTRDEDARPDDERERPELPSSEEVGYGFARKTSVQEFPPAAECRRGEGRGRVESPEGAAFGAERVREEELALETWRGEAPAGEALFARPQKCRKSAGDGGRGRRKGVC